MRGVGRAFGAAPILAVLASLAGCAYQNTMYNAERLYERAERSRRAGQDSIARAMYLEVVDKTGEAYRARPESAWAPGALFLLARARLRLGEPASARGALEQARARATGPFLRGLEVYFAEVAARGGDDAEALERLNEALRGPLEDDVRADAHLLRGRWLLSRGRVDQGWWDLDRAAEAMPGVRVEAGLERLRWSVAQGDRDRARRAADLLLSYREGGDRLEEMKRLARSSGERWGASSAADLLAGVDGSAWEREARGRLRLERARLLREAGDSAAAVEEAWRVARGLGDAAAEARLHLSRWHLQRSDDIAEAYAVRSILLPAGAHPEIVGLVQAVDELASFTDIGLGDPLGWFAAAEVARDRLDASYLARGLFLAYADGAPGDPWVPKALLAALAVSPTEGDRAWLQGRLEAYPESPYVLAARGGPGAGFEALEEELAVRLRELKGR